jgi:hypothetical protein
MSAMTNESIARLVDTVVDRVYRTTRRAYAKTDPEMDLVVLLAETNFRMMEEFAPLFAEAAIQPQIADIRKVLNDSEEFARRQRDAHRDIKDTIKDFTELIDGKLERFEQALVIAAGVAGTAESAALRAEAAANKCVEALAILGGKYIEEAKRKS